MLTLIVSLGDEGNWEHVVGIAAGEVMRVDDGDMRIYAEDAMNPRSHDSPKSMILSSHCKYCTYSNDEVANI